MSNLLKNTQAEDYVQTESRPANQPPRGRLIGAPRAAFRRSVASQSYAAQTKSQPAVPRQERRIARAVAPVTETVRKALNPWLVMASAAGMIAMGVLCAMFWPTALAVGEPAPLLVASGAGTSQQRIELPLEPGAALATALDDLGAAIDGAPQGSTEEILRRVSKPERDCGMVWVNNSPSVVFGRYPIRANSLAWTLESCAQAVLRMH
jgi:hypothetical protein